MHEGIALKGTLERSQALAAPASCKRGALVVILSPVYRA